MPRCELRVHALIGSKLHHGWLHVGRVRTQQCGALSKLQGAFYPAQTSRFSLGTFPSTRRAKNEVPVALTPHHFLTNNEIPGRPWEHKWFAWSTNSPQQSPATSSFVCSKPLLLPNLLFSRWAHTVIFLGKTTGAWSWPLISRRRQERVELYLHSHICVNNDFTLPIPFKTPLHTHTR